MGNPDRPHARLALATALTVLLAVWIGGSVTVDAIVIPVALDELPRGRFAEFGGELFQRLNFVEAILGAAGILLCFFLGRRGWGSRGRHVFATTTLTAMTVLVLLFLVWLTPTMLSKVRHLQEMGVDLGNSADMPPERESFRSLHTIYSALDVLKILAGTFLLYLLAVRRGK